MFNELEPEERLRLLRFVCSFAWADLEIAPEEREFVGKIVDRMDLDVEERKQVFQWLKSPPTPEEVDPAEIPAEHRELFVAAAEQTILADHEVTQEEIETLAIFKKLLE